MKQISIDIECYSDVELAKSGVYKYSESPNAELLLFGYAVDGGEVQVVDVARGEEIPEEILLALSDEAVTKWAFNANFERVFLSNWLLRNHPEYFFPSEEGFLDPSSWRCSMVWSAYMGLPMSLAGVGSILKLEEQKLHEGKDLIRYFCVPCKATKVNGGRTRNLPEDAPEKWELFKSYNKRDVEVEMQIQERLKKFPVPDEVWKEYHLDQEINDRGIGLDMELVRCAITFDERSKSQLKEKMQELTGLENPNSVQQMSAWLLENGQEMGSLGKKEVAAAIKTAPEEIRKVLALRLQLAKSSVKKYQAMEAAACMDNRARGMFMFYGANRTGRFAGRIIQLQNLPQNHMSDLAEARDLVRSGDYEAMELLYDDIPDTLSQLVRTAFVPQRGMKFIVADFSAIEARVIAHLAGESWRMELFKEGGDIYCKSASQMFGVPVVKHGVNGELRQKGKIAELACIAEGEPVLTDKGLVPIEKVTKEMKLWDGENWVSHDGVIYKGEREVITYEGLTATPDHLVWVQGEPRPIHFGLAAARREHLAQTGIGRTPIRLGENHISGDKDRYNQKTPICTNSVHRLLVNTMAVHWKLAKRQIQRMSELFTEKNGSTVVIQKTDGSETEMRKPQYQGLQQLWRTRHQIQLSDGHTSWAVSDRDIRTSRKKHGIRSDRHQWRLCSGESSVCITQDKLHQSAKECAVGVFTGILALRKARGNKETVSGAIEGRDYSGCRKSSCREKKKLANHLRKARLYDIRNAGEHHRFTVSGHLVHNCGYGGSVGALKAMGALEMGLSEDELQPLVDSWRSSNPHIVQLWWAVDRCVKQAVKEKTTTKTHGIEFSYRSGMLFIKLPSGRSLAYVKPRIGENRFGGESITYEGVGATKKWERIESYGPKFVENIVQGISRDILMYAMRTLSFCRICGHVHDELIIECSKDVSLSKICELMGRTPPWIPGLVLRADGYECEFYKKD